MARYMKQGSRTAICGPVAILNLWKFFRPTDNVRWAEYGPDIKNEVGYVPYHGTKISDMTQYMYTNWVCYPVVNPSLKEIDVQLKSHYPVLLRHIHKEAEAVFGHYCLLIGKQGPNYLVANDVDCKRAIEIISRSKLKSYLETSQKDWKNPDPIAWFPTGSP